MNLKCNPFYLTENQVNWVKEKLNSLSLPEKVGQVFCVLGDIFDDNRLISLVKDYNVGGILFRPNSAKSINQRYELVDAAAKIPLLKAANLEEGGSGAISGGTFFGSQMQVAATADISTVNDFAAVCACEGQSVGINWTFSPVCDIDYNYMNPITNVRTFGSNPKTVERCAAAYIKGVQSSGIAACAKHFPGDGVDYRDQHLHTSVNGLSAKKWHSTYGQIYKTLIDGGLLSIMAGHIMQPEVEREADPSLKEGERLPASLSKPLITNVLRDRYKFNGVVATDATIMGGYTMAMERKKAIPLSIAAGCDMIVFNTDFTEDYRFLLDGLKSGILSEERLNEAVTRILALKAKVCFNRNAALALNAAQKATACADKAVTLVKNTEDVLPIDKTRFTKIKLIVLGKDGIADGSITQIVKERLEREGFAVETYKRGAGDLHGVGDIDKKGLTLYLANEPTESNRVSLRLSWDPKHALDIPRFINEESSVFVSLSNPYHLQDVPQIKTYINAYSATKVVIQAVIDKLLGKSGFTGKSPVDAFCGLIDTTYGMHFNNKKLGGK
jgi:beta-N-acetylhexosaminidase